jgi:hypothetical protein
MSNPDALIITPDRTAATPRARRGAAAVIAQYIQDLTHPADSGAAAA